MRPGTTYSPVASMTRPLPAGAMLLATRTTFAPATATSITALMLFRASMTWPPLIKRVYCGSWAVSGAVTPARQNNAQSRRESRR